MANKVTIDIIANFKDNASKKAGSLLSFLDRLEKKTARLAGGKANLTVGLKDGLSSRLNALWAKAQRFDRAKFAAQVDAIDNASRTLGAVSTKAEQLARGTYRVTLGAVDKASRTASAAANTIKGIVSVGYNFTLGVVDKVTAPARAVVNSLNSVLGLAGAGVSGYGLVVKPIQMQVDYENLTTAFEVLLGGSAQAQKRIDELTAFAGQTPFTRDEIYKANRILQVYTGDALGSTNALGGVKMVGDIAAGIEGDFNSVAIWVGRLYSALEGGRPVGEMTAALQDMGAMGSAGRAKLEALTEEIASGSKTIKEAWPEAVEVFSQYEGIMEKQSNKLGNLLLGLKSFVNNNFLKRIGTGIGSELSPALTKFRTWRNENKALFAEMSDGVEGFAAGVTGRAVGAIESLTEKLSALRGTEAWQSADFFGKASLSFDALIGQPFDQWWSGKGKTLVTRKLSSAGGFLGRGLTKNLSSLLGFNWDGAAAEGLDLGQAFLGGFTSALGGSQLRTAFEQALQNLPGLGTELWNTLSGGARWLKINWQENIAEPFGQWWDSGGKELFTEKGAQLGQWLGQGLTTGAQWLSSGILSLLGIENDGVFAEAASVGESFWSSFTGAIDGEAISSAIVDAVGGVWSKLPGWAQVLLGGYGISKAAGMVSPVIGFGSGLLSFGKNVKSIFGSPSGGTGLLGFGANAAIAMGGGNLSGGMALGAGGLSALGLGAVGGGIAGTATVISGIGDIGSSLASQGQESAYYGWRAGSKIGGTGLGALTGAALGSVIPGVGTLIGGLIGAGLGGLGGSVMGDGLAAWFSGLDEPIEDYKRRMAGLDKAMAGYSAQSREAIKQTKLTGEEFQALEAQKLSEWYGDVSLSAQETGELARQAFTDIIGPDALRRANAFESAISKTNTSLASLEDNWQTVQNLSWKLETGLTLSEGEKETFISSVEGVISSAQSYLNDKEFQVSAAFRLLMGDDADGYISGSTSAFGQLHGELNELQSQIHQLIQDALSETDDTPFEIDLDESKIIQGYLDKVASITQRLNDAQQQAKLKRLEVEFGGVDADEETIVRYNAEMDAYRDTTIGQYNDAFEQGANAFYLQHSNGTLTDRQLQEELDELEAERSGKIAQLNKYIAKNKLEFSQSYYDNVLADAQSLMNGEGVKELAGAINWSGLRGMEDEVKSPNWNWDNWLEGKLGTPEMEKAMERLQAQAPMIKKRLSEYARMYIAAGEEVPQEVMDGLKSMNALEKGDFSSIFSNMWETLAQEAEANGFEEAAASLRAYGLIAGGSFGEGIEESSDLVARSASALRLFADRTLTDQFSSPFNVEADVHIKLIPVIKSAKVGIKAGIDVATNAVLISGISAYASGGFVHGKQLSWLDEENQGEAVIPLNPARRESARRLWAETGSLLGMEPEAESLFPTPQSWPVQSSGVTVEMGGVTVNITLRGGGNADTESLQSQAEELAEQVAGVLADKLQPILYNMPARA